MKIVRIIARLNIGGPARNAVILSDYETVLVCGEVAEGEGDMMYLARGKGINPIIVKELGREILWKDDWTAFWKIYKIIRREKPDIIHTHTAKAGTLGRIAGILYNFNSRPLGTRPAVLVHTFHGHVFSGYFGKIKTLFFICIERFLALFTDKIITVSENLKRELVEKFKIAPGNKISVIELGFELGEFFKLFPKENAEAINIGIVGRLVPIKNHKMILDCARNLKQYACSNSIRIVIVGDGEMRSDLEKYAEKLGICDMVEFRGWVKDLKAIYEGLDIVALTSLNEGTPVSLIEAMAAARPVVATDVGGVRDIVEDGKCGYLVESGDEEKFSERLMDLIKDAEKRKRFGEYGRELARERFSKDRLIRDMDVLYRHLLG